MLNIFFYLFKGTQINLDSANQAGIKQQISAQVPLQQQQSSILEKMEYPFLTLQQYPIGFIKTICGVVCARSVKLHTSLPIVTANEIDIRDKWWIELRNEIRLQMKSFNCHAVLGYTETKAICDDLVVLSAMGTAALVDDKYFCNQNLQLPPSQHNPNLLNVNTSFNENLYNYDYVSNFNDFSNKTCSICHLIPSMVSASLNQQANESSTNNSASQQQQQIQQTEVDEQYGGTQIITNSTCAQCSQAQVPNVLFLTIQPLPELLTVGKGCFIKALVSRSYKKSNGETTARIISDCLPFIEYELHRQLINKLKINGMNTLYGLKIQISIGENLIIGVAEATACFTACLPQSELVKLASSSSTSRKTNGIDDLNLKLKNILMENIKFYEIKFDNIKLALENVEKATASANGSCDKHSHLITQQMTELEQFDQATHVIKIDLDDFLDMENVDVLLNIIYKNKEGFSTCSTQYMPGLVTNINKNLQTFIRVYRCETSLGLLNTKQFNNIIDKILLSLRYKFRYYKNCCLTNIAFDFSLYDDDHCMIIVTGSCLVYDLINNNMLLNKIEKKELKNGKNSASSTSSSFSSTSSSSSSSNENNCELTTLNYISNSVIDRYLGYINLFIIRESTSIKESGGLNGFVNYFINEMLSMTRAHVLSLGGNALVSFKLNECFLIDNPHKNLGQCLINIAGDVVQTTKINHN